MPPYDKQQSRPLMPTLASSRTTKTPLTPRLATSNRASPSPATTPHVRSTAPRDVTVTPRVAASREDLNTPTRQFLNDNVTPRSGSRRTRVDNSASSTPRGTPTGTPNSTRPTSVVESNNGDFATTRSPAIGVHSNTPPVIRGGAPRSRTSSNVGSQVQSNPKMHGLGISRPESRERDASDMFFHANDARSSEQISAPPAKKVPTFFYANGIQDDTPSRPTSNPSPTLPAAKPNPPSLFFHADGSAEQTASPDSIASPSGSTVGSLPFQTGPQSPGPQMHSLQPASPTKDNFHLSYRKGASQIMRPSIQRSTPSQILQDHRWPTGEFNARRRTSDESAASANSKIVHNKSTSLSSIDSIMTPPKPTTQPPSRLCDSVSSPSIDTSNLIPSKPPPEGVAPTSPLKSPTSATNPFQRLDELAANARRERKVLDLEISNSSLLAINRQLEREMRKQKAELRRFRRLSRTGRISMTSSRTISSEFDTLDSVGEENEDGNGSDDLEADFDEEDEEDLSSSSASLSDDLDEEATAHRRWKDSKRLQLDLSKHRQLLVDSQKMNQSLRRCLGWTEELIRDGHKALSYRVRVDEVKIGGKVLTPDDEIDVSGIIPFSDPEGEAQSEREDQRRRGLLSAWREPDEFRLSIDTENTDLDSGVDVDERTSLGVAKPIAETLEVTKTTR